MPKARRRDEMARLEAELEAVRPFLPLAREIHEEASRAAIDAVPRRYWDNGEAAHLGQLIGALEELDQLSDLDDAIIRS